MIKIMSGLEKLTKDNPGLTTEDLMIEYVEEYERLLVNTQLRLGTPLTDLLPTHKEQYFHLMNKIADVAYYKIERKYRVKE